MQIVICFSDIHQQTDDRYQFDDFTKKENYNKSRTMTSGSNFNSPRQQHVRERTGQSTQSRRHSPTYTSVDNAKQNSNQSCHQLQDQYPEYHDSPGERRMQSSLSSISFG